MDEDLEPKADLVTGTTPQEASSRAKSRPESGTAIKPSPLVPTTNAWAVGMQREHSAPYLEGKIPILLGELVDFSVHLAFFSLQVLALPEGLVQAHQQAAGEDVIKAGGANLRQVRTSLGTDAAEETKVPRYLCAMVRNYCKFSSKLIRHKAEQR